MSDLREALEALTAEFDAEAENAEVGSRNSAEANDGVGLQLWEMERHVYQRASLQVRAILAAHPEPETTTEWGVLTPGGRIRMTCDSKSDARLVSAPYERAASRQVTAWQVAE